MSSHLKMRTFSLLSLMVPRLTQAASSVMLRVDTALSSHQKNVIESTESVGRMRKRRGGSAGECEWRMRISLER